MPVASARASSAFRAPRCSRRNPHCSATRQSPSYGPISGDANRANMRNLSLGMARRKVRGRGAGQDMYADGMREGGHMFAFILLVLHPPTPASFFPFLILFLLFLLLPHPFLPAILVRRGRENARVSLAALLGLIPEFDLTASPALCSIACSSTSPIRAIRLSIGAGADARSAENACAFFVQCMR